MIVSQNKFVSLVYELKENDENGKVIEITNEDNALKFIFGTGMMLPMFEENIKGLKVDDGFAFKLDAENAYGPIFEEAKADIPKNVFEVEGKIDTESVFVGNVLPMQDKDGNMFYGKILEMNDDIIKMDFNHPLAGVNLHFKGKLLEVREATDDELKGEHDHSCGCGCN